MPPSLIPDSDPTLDDKLLKGYAPALNSVYKKQQQIVAVACKPASLAGHPTFILDSKSRNVKAKVRKRLDSLLSHLLCIGTLYGERYGQHFPADQGMAARNLALDDPHRMSYLTGELRALHHCWRITDASRNMIDTRLF